MKRQLCIVACSLLFALPVGCLYGRKPLRLIPSPGVQEIPTTIGIHPFVSAPVGRRMIPRTRALSLSVEVRDDEIYIVPPTKSELRVTSFSQMFTGYVSAEMADYGFDLREIPVELPDNDDMNDQGRGGFVISLALLDELQERYGLKAILIGDVYFIRNPNYPADMEVASVYAKLIDVQTLKVLCQVTLPFDTRGLELDEVAELLAGELAVLAGLAEPAAEE